jgi:hypothetical protein
MNCCDYDCNQGRNCPARATPVKGVSPGTIEGFWPSVFKKRKRADPEPVAWWYEAECGVLGTTYFEWRLTSNYADTERARRVRPLIFAEPGYTKEDIT